MAQRKKKAAKAKTTKVAKRAPAGQGLAAKRSTPGRPPRDDDSTLERVNGFGSDDASAYGAGAGRARVIVGGRDERVRISDTSAFPWSAIAFVTMTYATGAELTGSAFFIGPRALATAAHNIHEPRFGRALAMNVKPAFGGIANPRTAKVVDHYIPPAWTRGFNPVNDWGVLILADDSYSRGYFGLSELASPPDDLEVNVCGYANDRSPRAQYFNGGRVGPWSASFVDYKLDTGPGMSGSPVFYKARGKENRIAVGIHIEGRGNINRARRINGAVFTKLASYQR